MDNDLETQGTPIILVHSSASSGRQWRALSEQLGGRYRVHAPDLNGYGCLAKTADSTAFDDDLGLVGDLVRQQQRKVHLVGHSYGGLIAARTAFDHRQNIRSLSLIEPVCFHLLKEARDSEALEEIATVRDRQIAMAECGDYNASAHGFIDYWMGTGTWVGMSEESRLAVASVMPKVAAEWPGAFRPTTRLADYASLPWPLLLIAAADTTRAAGSVIDLIRKSATGAEYAEIASGGHMAPVTNRVPVNAALEAFLARV